MNYTIYTILFLAPAIAFARSGSTSFWLGDFSIWVAIVIGLVAGVLVLRNAQKIGPSLLRRVYLSFGVGMLLVVVALILIAAPLWANELIVNRTRDIFLILGFGLMASGAGQMLRAVGLK